MRLLFWKYKKNRMLELEITIKDKCFNPIEGSYCLDTQLSSLPSNLKFFPITFYTLPGIVHNNLRNSLRQELK